MKRSMMKSGNNNNNNSNSNNSNMDMRMSTVKGMVVKTTSSSRTSTEHITHFKRQRHRQHGTQIIKHNRRSIMTTMRRLQSSILKMVMVMVVYMSKSMSKN